MHTTQDLLDLAKTHSKLASDYKLGIALGLTSSGISNYRHGRSKPDDLIGARLADLAGLDAGYVLACLHADRAQDASARSVWQSVAERLAAASAAAAVAGLVVVGIPDALAHAPDWGATACLCIMSNRLARLISACINRRPSIHRWGDIPGAPA